MSATTWFIIAIVGFSLSGIALITAIFMFLKMNIPAVIGELTGKTVAREVRAIRESNAGSGNRTQPVNPGNVEHEELTEVINEEMLDNSAMAMAHVSKRLDQDPYSVGTEELSSKQVDRNKKSRLDGSAPTEYLSENVAEVAFEESSKLISGGKKTDILVEVQSMEDESTTTEVEPATELLSPIQITDILSETEPIKDMISESEPPTEILSRPQPTDVLDDNISAPINGTTVLNNNDETEVKNVVPVSFSVVRNLVAIHSNERIG